MNIILDETGRKLKCSDAQFKNHFKPAGWRCTDKVVVVKEELKLEPVKTVKKSTAPKPKADFLDK